MGRDRLIQSCWWVWWSTGLRVRDALRLARWAGGLSRSDVGLLRPRGLSDWGRDDDESRRED